MIPIDNFEKWKERLHLEKAKDVLNADEKIELNKISFEKRSDILREMFESPISCANITVMYSLYFRNKWLDALATINKKAPVSVFEIAPGGNDVIPSTVSRLFNHPDTVYTASNTNKMLTKLFYENTKNLPIKIKVIEEQAQMMTAYAKPEQFDAVVFEHSVNDIIYDMIARKNGLDTTNEDWFSLLSETIRHLNGEYADGTYESTVKDEILNVFSSCLNVLKKDSYIIINHFQYQEDLDWGMNYEIWDNLLPAVRKWVNEAKIGQEVFFDDFEPQWWMFIKKV